jgi:hypothetical protein
MKRPLAGSTLAVFREESERSRKALRITGLRIE